MAEPKPSFPAPSVLIIEDDPGTAEYLAKNFHEQTSIAVLRANTLAQAREMIDNPRLVISAILSDLNFTNETIDPNHNLFSGMDILAYSKQKRGDLPKYVFSFWLEKEPFRRQAQESGLLIKQWFQKMSYDERDQRTAPWSQIERDLINDLAQAAGIRSRVALVDSEQSMSQEALAEYVRALYGSFRRIRATYVPFAASDQFYLKQPVEAVCVECDPAGEGEEGEEGETHFRCWTLDIGLLVPGEGETMENALDDLGNIILEQYEEWEDHPEIQLEGHAAVVKKRLDSYVGRKG